MIARRLSAVLLGLLTGLTWGTYFVRALAPRPIAPIPACHTIETRSRPPHALIPVGPVIRVCAPAPVQAQ